MLLTLLSESLLLAPPLLPHAARERTSRQKAGKMQIPPFKLLLLLFEKHRKTCGNFSENGEIYTYNIIYIMSIVWSAFF